MKIILYQKNSNKPIVISDPDGDLESIKENIKSIFKGKDSGPVIVSTSNDFVIFKSSELAAAMITNKKGQKEESKTYEQSLTLSSEDDK